MAKVPNWGQDPSTCPYCKDGVFPHSHHEDQESTPMAKPKKTPVRREKAAVPRKSKAQAEPRPDGQPRRRGRPMKAETWELLKTCTCEHPVIS